MGPENSRSNFFWIFQSSPLLPKPQVPPLAYTHLARRLVFPWGCDRVRTQKWTLPNKVSNMMRKQAILHPNIRCVFVLSTLNFIWLLYCAVCFLLFFYCLSLHYSRMLLMQLFIKWPHEIPVLLLCWFQWAAAMQPPLQYTSKKLKAKEARLEIEAVRLPHWAGTVWLEMTTSRLLKKIKESKYLNLVTRDFNSVDRFGEATSLTTQSSVFTWSSLTSMKSERIWIRPWYFFHFNTHIIIRE